MKENGLLYKCAW